MSTPRCPQCGSGSNVEKLAEASPNYLASGPVQQYWCGNCNLRLGSQGSSDVGHRIWGSKDPDVAVPADFPKELPPELFDTLRRYLHNTLGNHQWMEEHAKKVFEAYFNTDSFRSYLRTLVMAEIRAASGSSDLPKFITAMMKDEVRRHILDKFRVDVKITLVEPPDGVDRNIMSPDIDPVGEVREA